MSFTPVDPNPNTRAHDGAHRASATSSAMYVRAKNVTCAVCRKARYASLSACPFCPAPAPAVALDAEALEETGEHPTLPGGTD